MDKEKSPTVTLSEMTFNLLMEAAVSHNALTKIWSVYNSSCIINFLLTKRKSHTGEYWPEVVALVRTETSKGQYFPVRSRASEISNLFIIWHRFFE